MAVREICNRHGLLLILDEVQTGLGRTGKLFAYEHFGIEPDIMTLAKALAGGAPIGTMLAKEKYAAAFSPGTHGSTFGGNPLMTAAALAAVNALLDEKLLERATARGAYLVARLEGLKKKHAIVEEVRGIGLMVGMKLAIPGGEIVKQGHARGLLLNVTHDTVLRFVPPLVISENEIDEGMAILDELLVEAGR
jgi:acetylornithine aminotransferase